MAEVMVSRYLLCFSLITFTSDLVKGDWTLADKTRGRPRCSPGWTVLIQYYFIPNSYQPPCSSDHCLYQRAIDGVCIADRPHCPRDFQYRCPSAKKCIKTTAGCIQDSLLNECGAHSRHTWGFLHSRPEEEVCRFSIHEGESSESSESSAEPTVTVTLHQLHVRDDAAVYACADSLNVTATGTNGRLDNCSRITATPAGTVVNFDGSNVTISIEPQALESRTLLIEWKSSRFEQHEDDYRVLEAMEDEYYEYADEEKEEDNHVVLIAVLATLILCLVIVVVVITVCVLRKGSRKNRSSSTNPNANHDQAQSNAYVRDDTRRDTQRPLPEIYDNPQGGHVYEEIDILHPESGSYPVNLEHNNPYDNANTFKVPSPGGDNPLEMPLQTGYQSDDGVGNGRPLAVSRPTALHSVDNSNPSPVLLRGNSLYNRGSPDTEAPTPETHTDQVLLRDNSLYNQKNPHVDSSSWPPEPVYLRENSLYNENESEPTNYVEAAPIESEPNNYVEAAPIVNDATDN